MSLAYCICGTTAAINNQQRESILAALTKYGMFMTPFYSKYYAVLFEVEKAMTKALKQPALLPLWSCNKQLSYCNKQDICTLAEHPVF
jgi:hypothetical protein